MTLFENAELNELMHKIGIGEKEQRLDYARRLQKFLLIADDFKFIGRDPFPVLYQLDEQFFARIPAEIKREIARCVGAIGYIMVNKTKEYLQWLFDNYESASNDDVKGLYMLSLAATFEFDTAQKRLEKYALKALSELQKLLEIAIAPVLLTIVGVVLNISESYPVLFQPHFQDVIDVIIGWYIDPDLQRDQEVLDQLDAVFVRFRPFWVHEINFTIRLLSQFLEDSEAYCEDFDGGRRRVTAPGESEEKEHPSDPADCLQRILALLRVFRAVFCGLLGDATIAKDNVDIIAFVNQSLNGLAAILSSVVESSHFMTAQVVKTDLLCFEQVMKCCKSCLDSVLPQIFASINKVCSAKQRKPDLLLSALDLLQQVFDCVPSDQVALYISEVISPAGCLWRLRFHPLRKVSNRVLTLHRELLKPKGVKCLQEVYRHIRLEIAACLAYLHGAGDADGASGNPFILPALSSAFTSAVHYERTAIFLFGLLQELGSVKNSVIAMWALDPSLFVFLSRDVLSARFFWQSSTSPSVVMASVMCLRSHCKTHDYFLSSSDLVANASGPLVSSPTSKHFANLLGLLSSILAFENISADIRSVCLTWSQDILDAVKNLTVSLVFSSSDFETFAGSVANCCLLNRGLQGPVRAMIECAAPHFSTKFWNGLTASLLLCCGLLSKWKAEVRLFIDAPLDVVLRANSNATSLCEKMLRNRRQLMRKATTGSFQAEQFKKIMDFLLDGTPISAFENGVQTFWRDDLEMLLSLCTRQHAQQNDKSWEHVNQLWWWATWECAGFCVASRLKTPLGKPQDTFMAIESCVKAFANEALLKTPNGANAATSKGDCGRWQWFRVRMLLDFMECLDKHMYAAYQGCALALYSVNKNARTFFLANRKVCSEWLNRLRLAVMTVAVNNDYSELALRFAWQAFADIASSPTSMAHASVDTLLLLTAQALVQLRASNALSGLTGWLKEAMGVKTPPRWIAAAVDKAQAQYERAATQYMQTLNDWVSSEDSNGLSNSSFVEVAEEKKQLLLHNKNSALSPQCLSYIADEVTDSYKRLCDWKSAATWLDSLTEIKGRHAHSEKYFSASGSQDDYIRYINRYLAIRAYIPKPNPLIPPLPRNNRIFTMLLILWEGFNNFVHFQSLHFQLPIRTLMALASFDDNNLTDAQKYFESILPSDKPLLEWSMASVCESVNKKLFKLVLDSAMKEKSDVEKSLVDITDVVCNAVHMHACAVWPLVVNADTQTQLQCAKILRSTLNREPFKLTSLLGGSMNSAAVDRIAQVAFWIRGDCKTKGNADLAQLNLLTAKRARKCGNYRFAEKLTRSVVESSWQHANATSTLSELMLAKGPQDLPSTVPLHSYISLCRHVAKIMHDRGQEEEGFGLLCEAVTNVFDSPPLQVVAAGSKNLVAAVARRLCSVALRPQDAASDQLKYVPETLSRALSTLADWMQAESASEYGDVLLRNEESVFIKLLEEQLQESVVNDAALDSGSVVDALLSLAVKICPIRAKNQATLADWAYKAGRKLVDAGGRDERPIALLSDSELGAIQACLPHGVTEIERDAVLAIMNAVTSDEDCAAAEDSLRVRLMHACPGLNHADQLLDVWRVAKGRVFRHFDLAAKAYFSYLQLVGQDSAQKSDYVCVTATLRLLRLLIKYSQDMKTTLEDGFRRSHAGPWKGIIPQLFARLNHPAPFVRVAISELLCRIAQDSPQLVVYQAVVGSSVGFGSRQVQAGGVFFDSAGDRAGPGGADIAGAEQEFDLGDAVSERASTLEEALMKDCYSQILSAVAKQDAGLTSELTVFIQELHRITLLRDELWLLVLTHLQSELDNRIKSIEREAEKAAKQAMLTAAEIRWICSEKENVLMETVRQILIDLRALTTCDATTAHEQLFAENFAPIIEKALEHYAMPGQKPTAAWRVFRDLLSTLAARASKKTSMQLDLQDISPVLASFAGTRIPMPGSTHLDAEGKPVCVSSVARHVAILPTKTKPKRVWFVGSDGKKYPFLFKGLEDLHLDERVMQFLQVCNMMFAKEGDKYFARHYSVTPLGPRSGLIQWVDGATPLFSMYKRWQMREAAVAGGDGSALVTLRPGEVFHRVLDAELLRKGIMVDDRYRHLWPPSLLKQTLIELISQTPKDLLQKEMWCLSTSPAEWWQTTETFARCSAVMSIIGYIIGLGDRHLDNVLVDLHSGQVVHIDYNICFEKGKQLKVPERVPFRMTPNVQAALGLTGVHGTFSASCEHVLGKMRQSREVLLTLLEAFVYDPLVDWTLVQEVGVHGLLGHHIMFAIYGSARISQYRALNQQLALRMYLVRYKEMEPAWKENKIAVAAALDALSECLQQAVVQQEQLVRAKRECASLEDQIALVRDAVNNPDHALYTLPDRYACYLSIAHEIHGATAAVTNQLRVCNDWIRSYERAFDALRDLAPLREEIATMGNVVAPAAYTVAEEVMKNAGQMQTLQQCVHLDDEQRMQGEQFTTLLLDLCSCLATYSDAQTHMPLSHYANHRAFHWQRVLSELAGAHDVSTAALHASVAQLVQLETGRSAALDNEHTKHAVVIDVDLAKCLSALMYAIQQLKQARSACADDLLNTAEFPAYSLQQMHNGRLPIEVKDCNKFLVAAEHMLLVESAVTGGSAVTMPLNLTPAVSLVSSHLEAVCRICNAFVDTQETVVHSRTFAALIELFEAMSTVYVGFGVASATFLKACVAEQPGFMSLATAIEQVIAQVGFTLVQLMQEFLAMANSPETGNEALLLTLRAVRAQYRHVLDEAKRSADGVLVQLSGVLEGIWQAFERLCVAWKTGEKAVDIGKLDAWMHLDVVAGVQALPSTGRVMFKDELLFLLQFAAVYQMLNVCNEHAIFFSANDPSCAGSVSVERVLLQLPEEILVGCWKQTVLGLFSKLVCCLFLGVEDQSKPETTLVNGLDKDGQHGVNGSHEIATADSSSVLNSAVQLCKTSQADALMKFWHECCSAVLLSGESAVQALIVVHQWRHEQILRCAGRTSFVQPAHSELLAHIQTKLNDLSVKRVEFLAYGEKLFALEGSVAQRLRWAAGGNPALHDAQSKFEMLERNRKERDATLIKFGDRLTEVCHALLHFDLLAQDTTETLELAHTVQHIVQRLATAIDMKESSDQMSVSSVEEQFAKSHGLMNTQVITATWLQQTLETLDAEGTDASRLVLAAEADLADGIGRLIMEATAFRGVLGAHHKMMTDLRPYLKALAKHEELNPSLGHDFSAYVNLYKAFSEQLAHIVRSISSLDVSHATDIAALLNSHYDLIGRLDVVYDKLAQLNYARATPSSAEKGEEAAKGQAAVMRAFLPQKGGAAAARREDVLGTTAGVTQERNAQALAIWRRVKHKLEGRDPDSTRRSSVQEQTQYIIQEAVSLDNLALMYEGWTAWV